MSRHVSLACRLDLRNYRGTDITGWGAHYTEGRYSLDYLIIVSSINITITNTSSCPQELGMVYVGQILM